MTEPDQQRIAEWIGDAFAILCVRVGGLSRAETNLRLGFEAILRQLGTPPLRIIAASPPAFGRGAVTTAELRLIRKALDCCAAVFQRYERVLTPSQRRNQALVRSARDFAEQELRAREMRGPACSTPSTLLAA
jgi:hypothetical protein